jgi:hypothetical protein
MAQLFAFLDAQAILAVVIVDFDLLDPAMSSRGTGLKLPRQAFHNAAGSRQRNNLIPEFR